MAPSVGLLTILLAGFLVRSFRKNRDLIGGQVMPKSDPPNDHEKATNLCQYGRKPIREKKDSKLAVKGRGLQRDLQPRQRRLSNNVSLFGKNQPALTPESQEEVARLMELDLHAVPEEKSNKAHSPTTVYYPPKKTHKKTIARSEIEQFFLREKRCLQACSLVVAVVSCLTLVGLYCFLNYLFGNP